MNQSFINGFVKRAKSLGMDETEAYSFIVEHLKEAQLTMPPLANSNTTPAVSMNNQPRLTTPQMQPTPSIAPASIPGNPPAMKTQMGVAGGMKNVMNPIK